MGRSRRSTRAALALAAALVVAASACGGGSDAAGGKRRLPGIKEFGFNEEQFADHVTRVEARIATCMRNAGFEYYPVDVATIEAGQHRVRRDPNLTHREYQERYGYAVTTRFDNPPREIAEGPRNRRIFAALSEADQAAYERTLWGEDTTATFVWSLDDEDFSDTGGCTRKAVRGVFTPAQVRGTFVNPKDVLVESDPRIIKAQRKWSACMKRHGYNYNEDQDEIIDEYGKRLDALTEGDDPATLTGDRKAALQRLQRAEIRVSLNDTSCEEKTTNSVFREVETEVFGQPVS